MNCVCGHSYRQHLHSGGRCDSGSKQCGCPVFHTVAAEPRAELSGHQCVINPAPGGFRAVCRCGWETCALDTIATAGVMATTHCTTENGRAAG